MRLPRRASFAALLLSLTVVGCGDDEDNPAAANSPCLDANTECASFSLRPSDMAFSEEYMDMFPIPPTTYFNGTWPTAGKVVVGYGPGKSMIVTVRFDTPLVVRYDTPSAFVALSAGAVPGCADRWASPTPTASVTGDWTMFQSSASVSENCSGSSRLEVAANFQNLQAGQSLTAVTWRVTVPDTYTDGQPGSPILPADLDVYSIGWAAAVDGDERGNPAIWPGEFP
jgi:hypothetical protein